MSAAASNRLFSLLGFVTMGLGLVSADVGGRWILGNHTDWGACHQSCMDEGMLCDNDMFEDAVKNTDIIVTAKAIHVSCLSRVSKGNRGVYFYKNDTEECAWQDSDVSPVTPLCDLWTPAMPFCYCTVSVPPLPGTIPGKNASFQTYPPLPGFCLKDPDLPIEGCMTDDEATNACTFYTGERPCVGYAKLETCSGKTEPDGQWIVGDDESQSTCSDSCANQGMICYDDTFTEKVQSMNSETALMGMTATINAPCKGFRSEVDSSHLPQITSDGICTWYNNSAASDWKQLGDGTDGCCQNKHGAPGDCASVILNGQTVAGKKIGGLVPPGFNNSCPDYCDSLHAAYMDIGPNAWCVCMSDCDCSSGDGTVGCTRWAHIPVIDVNKTEVFTINV